MFVLLLATLTRTVEWGILLRNFFHRAVCLREAFNWALVCTGVDAVLVACWWIYALWRVREIPKLVGVVL
jgi:hypothetical protein